MFLGRASGGKAIAPRVDRVGKRDIDEIFDPQAITGSDAQSSDGNIGCARGVLDIDQTLGAHGDDDS